MPLQRHEAGTVHLPASTLTGLVEPLEVVEEAEAEAGGILLLVWRLGSVRRELRPCRAALSPAEEEEERSGAWSLGSHALESAPLMLASSAATVLGREYCCSSLLCPTETQVVADLLFVFVFIHVYIGLFSALQKNRLMITFIW